MQRNKPRNLFLAAPKMYAKKYAQFYKPLFSKNPMDQEY